MIPILTYTITPPRRGVDPSLPGIYVWTVPSVGEYVGKSDCPARRLKHYPRNVFRLLRNLPYRYSKPDAYRLIHRALAYAARKGICTSVRVIENCPVADLDKREWHWIIKRGTLNGGSPVPACLREG